MLKPWLRLGFSFCVKNEAILGNVVHACANLEFHE